jgi:prepilin-type N-terminal cleavage/methylation domain-containing protein
LGWLMSQKAFTLLEITVVVAIIGLLAVIVLANYRGGEKQSALLRSTHRLAQDLRRVEEMAISAQETPPGCEQVEAGVFPKGGYGIYFEINPPQERCLSALEGKGYCIILFADCDQRGDYDDWGGSLTCADATSELGNSLKEKIEELTLEEGIKIKKLQVDSFPVDFLPITFTPPDPEVTIGGESGNKETVVTLCLKDNENITRTITVNKAGLIDTH